MSAWGYDMLAAKLLLEGAPPERMAALAVEASIAAGEQCPECGGRETESNGGSEYRCCGCDHRWGHDEGERYGF